jgi:uncharacterized protein YndB with AHSA1/START domain
MTEQAAATGSFTPVRCAVTVPLSPERAFALFTEGFFSWWPHGHQLGKADLADVVLEPRTGGRYYERGVDGSECDWGQVLACEPPHRIVVSWRINANDDTWFADPDPARASEFEVTFVAQPDGQTRVELEHRHFERHGAGGGGHPRGRLLARRLGHDPGRLRQGRGRGLNPATRAPRRLTGRPVSIAATPRDPRHAGPARPAGREHGVITMGRGDSQYAHQPVPG